jgi:hypothetical protein
MREFSREEAIAFADAGEWKEWNSFRRAIDEVFGREVQTFEYIMPYFKDELYSRIPEAERAEMDEWANDFLIDRYAKYGDEVIRLPGSEIEGEIE